jgi:FKBP-type peptidyl-prolyl cis-trans isomerase
LKRQKLLTLFAAGLFALAACTPSLKSPQEKAGYAVGMNIGQGLTPVKDDVDLGKVFAGMQDELAGKATMDQAAAMTLLKQLHPHAGGDKGQMGYAVGVNIGKRLTHIKDEINQARVISGIKDQLAGKPKMKPEDMNAALGDLSAKQKAKNLAAGAAYLESNKKKPGVQVTASGLQYEVLTLGKGRKPGPKNTVRVNYRGTLIDGTEFDSSYARNQPAEFPVTGVIPGWIEALQLMPVGSKYHLVIPAQLAYGDRGSQGGIEPGTMLIFDVELLAILK